MVRLVGFPQEQRRRTVGSEARLSEEVRVARGHGAVGDEEAGVAVVGVQAVAAPRVVAEHHVGLQATDPVGQLTPLGQPVLELAVVPAEEDHVVRAAEDAGRLPLLFLAGRDELG